MYNPNALSKKCVFLTNILVFFILSLVFFSLTQPFPSLTELFPFPTFYSSSYSFFLPLFR